MTSPVVIENPILAKQAFETEWTAERIEENRDINRIPEQVGLWRQGGRLHITPTTRRLIEYAAEYSALGIRSLGQAGMLRARLMA